MTQDKTIMCSQEYYNTIRFKLQDFALTQSGITTWMGIKLITVSWLPYNRKYLTCNTATKAEEWIESDELVDVVAIGQVDNKSEFVFSHYLRDDRPYSPQFGDLLYSTFFTR